MTGASERRVLVVDDEAAIRLAIAEILETEGYTVDAARDGAEALASMRQHRPALAIVDLMMPDVDGWSLLRSCRGDPTLADVPVIVMSARPDAPQAAAAAGASLCLIKPFDMDVLLTALDDTFRKPPRLRGVWLNRGCPHAANLRDREPPGNVAALRSMLELPGGGLRQFASRRPAGCVSAAASLQNHRDGGHDLRQTGPDERIEPGRRLADVARLQQRIRQVSQHPRLSPESALPAPRSCWPGASSSRAAPPLAGRR